MRFLALIILLFFVSLNIQANPFIGTWEYDKELTLQEAKEGNFKGHDISKIKTQTDYIEYASKGSLLWFSTVTRVDGSHNTSHFMLPMKNGISEEFSRSTGDKVIDRVLSKKLDDHAYEISGVRDPADPKKPNDWKGKVWVSKDKKYLRIKIGNIPDVDYLYFKVFKRTEEGQLPAGH